MAVNKATRAKTSPIKKGPSKGKLPVPDASHAANAMARMDQVSPPLSEAEKKTVARAVEKKLGHATEGTKKILGKGTAKKKGK